MSITTVPIRKENKVIGVSIDLLSDDYTAIRMLLTDNYMTLDTLSIDDQQRASLYKLVSSLEMIQNFNKS